MNAARLRRFLEAAHKFFQRPVQYTTTHLVAALVLSVAVAASPLAAKYWPVARAFVGEYAHKVWTYVQENGG